MREEHNENAMFERIDHIGIAVWDIEAALPYYQEVLQLRFVSTEVLPEVGIRLAYLDAGNTFIQLVEPLTSPTIRRFLEEHGEGLHHICFTVADLPTVLQQLTGEGEAAIFAGGRRRRCAFLLRHPSGVTIELTERVPYGDPPLAQEGTNGQMG
ncbi:VOC family protein [Thermogemmatispora sp.]|uniref:VOC family protein n=1 Tax=Thermogemmatispora sp. TaxID=1968838 RepID=UPI0035E4176F